LVNGRRFELISRFGKNMCRRVVAMEDTMIPARSQARIPGRIEMNRMDAGIKGHVWTTEANELRGGISVARTVVPERLNNVPVLVFNSSNVEKKVGARTVLADLTMSEFVEDDREMEGEGWLSCEHLDGLMTEIDGSITSEQAKGLTSPLKKYSDVFSRNELDLGVTPLAKHRIDTGDTRPIRQTLREQPFHLLKKKNEHVKEIIKAGVVEPSNSPWTSNLVVVKNKDGSFWYCVDYRKINSVTRRDAYPLPRIDACLNALSGAKLFSAFDLRSSYYQVPMHEDDADKTTIIVRTGTYRFKRVPFGLCNAGSTFKRVMDLALNGLNFNMCLVYSDDIIVYSTDVDEHIGRLEKLFERLRSANLKLKPSKCKLLRSELSFLGHVVSSKGVGTDPKKISAVQDWPVPTDVKEVRSFLGLASYYRKFVPSFAALAAPLHALTGKNKKFDWTSSCEDGFQKLKSALVSSPILAMPNNSDPFVLDTDACDVNIGAVLSQVQEGEERVIAYASRSLSKQERYYCVTRKEMLAVVFYSKSFRQYLLGRQFLIRTDHSALQCVKTTPEPMGQQARWCEILEEFDFQIVHRPGMKHGNADALSRRPCRQCGKEVGDGVRSEVRVIEFQEIIRGTRWTRQELIEVTKQDNKISPFYEEVLGNSLPMDESKLAGARAVTKSFHAQWERYDIVNGVMYRRWWDEEENGKRRQIVLPIQYREEAMRSAHASIRGGHMGVKKTQDKIAMSVYWIGWQRDVREYWLRCDACARYHEGGVKKRGELQSMCVGAPWERLAIDITGPHPLSGKGNKFIITVIDHFTKYAFAFPVRNHEARTFAKYLVERVFLIHGVPLQLLSDRGAEFEGHIFKEICELLGVDKLRTTAYKPSTNGALDAPYPEHNAWDDRG